MASRVLVVAALAASIAVAVVVITGKVTSRPQATTKHAPSIQVTPQAGYSCETASSNGCSLHPCVKYAFDQTGVAVDNSAPMITSTAAGRCSSTAKAPRAIPIVAPTP